MNNFWTRGEVFSQILERGRYYYSRVTKRSVLFTRELREDWWFLHKMNQEIPKHKKVKHAVFGYGRYAALLTTAS